MSEELNNLPSVEIIQGDLLESKVDLIVHQCNCITTRAVGIAESINKKYPYADIYSKRTTPDIPGTCKLGIKDNEQKIACLIAQYKPGKPSKIESSEMRISWFKSSLTHMLELIKDLNITTIGINFGIGCGYAAGNWSDYYNMIENFAKNNKYQVKLYKI